MGANALISNVKRHAIGSKMQISADLIVRRCQTCWSSNARTQRKPTAGEVKKKKRQ